MATEDQTSALSRLQERILSFDRFIDGYKYICDANTNTPQAEIDEATILYNRYFSLYITYFTEIQSGELANLVPEDQLAKITAFQEQSSRMDTSELTAEINFTDRAIVVAEMYENISFITGKQKRNNDLEIITYGLAAYCTNVSEIASAAYALTLKDIDILSAQGDSEIKRLAISECNARLLIFDEYKASTSRVSDLSDKAASKLVAALTTQAVRFKALSTLSKDDKDKQTELIADGNTISVYKSIVTSYTQKASFDKTVLSLYGVNSDAFLKSVSELRDAESVKKPRQMMKDLIGFDSNDLGTEAANNKLTGTFNLHKAIHDKHGAPYSEHLANFYTAVDIGCNDLFTKTLSEEVRTQNSEKLKNLEKQAFQLAVAELVYQLKTEENIAIANATAISKGLFGGGWTYDEFIKEAFKNRDGKPPLSNEPQVKALIEKYGTKFTKLHVEKTKQLARNLPEQSYAAQVARLNVSKSAAVKTPEQLVTLLTANPVLFRLALLEHAEDFKNNGTGVLIGSKTKKLTGYGSDELREVIGNLPATYNSVGLSPQINKAVNKLLTYAPENFAKHLELDAGRAALYQKMTPAQFSEMCTLSSSDLALTEITRDFSGIDVDKKTELLKGLQNLENSEINIKQAKSFLKLLAPEDGNGLPTLNFLKENSKLMAIAQKCIGIADQSTRFLPLLDEEHQETLLNQLVGNNLVESKLTTAIIEGLAEGNKINLLSILKLDTRTGPKISDEVATHILTNISYYTEQTEGSDHQKITKKAEEQVQLINSLTVKNQARLVTTEHINALAPETINNLVGDQLQIIPTIAFLTNLEEDAQNTLLIKCYQNQKLILVNNNILTVSTISILKPASIKTLLTHNAELSADKQTALIKKANKANLDFNEAISSLKPEAIKQLLASPEMGEIYNKLSDSNKFELRTQIFNQRLLPSNPDLIPAKIVSDIILESSNDQRVDSSMKHFLTTLSITPHIITTLLQDKKAIEFISQLKTESKLALLSSISLTNQMDSLCTKNIIATLDKETIAAIAGNKIMGSVYFNKLGIEAKKELITTSIRLGETNWQNILQSYHVNHLAPEIIDHLLLVENAPIITSLSAESQSAFMTKVFTDNKMWHYTNEETKKFDFKVATEVIEGLKPQVIVDLLELEHAQIFFERLSPAAKIAFKTAIIKIGNDAPNFEGNILSKVKPALLAYIILTGDENDHNKITPKFFSNFSHNEKVMKRGLNTENISVETEQSVVKNALVSKIFSSKTPDQITSFIEQLTIAGSKSALAGFVTQGVVNDMSAATIRAIGTKADLVTGTKNPIKVFLESAVTSGDVNALSSRIQLTKIQDKELGAVVVKSEKQEKAPINSIEFALLFMKNKDFRDAAVGMINKAHTDPGFKFITKVKVKDQALKTNSDNLKKPYLDLKELQKKINTAKKNGIHTVALQIEYNTKHKDFVKLCSTLLETGPNAPKIKNELAPLVDKILKKPEAKQDVLEAMTTVLKGEQKPTGVHNQVVNQQTKEQNRTL